MAILQTESQDDLAIVRFARTELTEQEARDAAQELRSLARQSGWRKLIVSFDGLSELSTKMLPSLLMLEQQARRRGGRIVFCCAAPAILEIFAVTQSDKLFHIEQSEQQALAAFATRRLEIGCPLPACGGAATRELMLLEGDQGLYRPSGPETCSDCGAEFWIANTAPDAEAAVVGRLSLTIAAEAPGGHAKIEVEHGDCQWEGMSAPATRIAVHGQLTEPAASALHSAWQAIPPPRWIVIDLTQLAGVDGVDDAALAILEAQIVEAQQHPGATAVLCREDGQQTLELAGLSNAFSSLQQVSPLFPLSLVQIASWTTPFRLLP